MGTNNWLSRAFGIYLAFSLFATYSYGGRSSIDNLQRISEDYEDLSGQRYWRPKYSKRGNAWWLKKTDGLLRRLAKIKVAKLDEDSKVTHRLLTEELKNNKKIVENGELGRDITGAESPPHLLLDIAFDSFENKTPFGWRWTINSLKNGTKATEKLINRYRVG